MYQKGGISPKIQRRRFGENQSFRVYEVFSSLPTILRILHTLVYPYFLWTDLYRDCLGVFKGLFGLFLDSLWPFLWSVCVQFCLWQVQRSVLEAVWNKNLV